MHNVGNICLLLELVFLLHFFYPTLACLVMLFMKNNIIGLFTLFLYLLFTGELQAQDAEFTQFYANPLYLNPAFAGSNICPRVSLNYRNQWPGLNKTYITYAASYDRYVRAVSGGIGALVLADKAGNGTLNTTDASLMYSYSIHPTREFSVSFGLQGTYHQKTVDWSKLTFGDMIDPKRGFVWNTHEQPKVYPVQKTQAVDFSAGILGYSKRYFFGLAAHHLNQPDEAFIYEGGSKLPMKITAHAGAMLPVGGKHSDTKISPNVLFQQQGNFQQLNLGFYVMHGAVTGGLWYRNQDSFILLLGYQTGMLRFGYSYDVTVNKLANATAGSHEISTQFLFTCKPPKKIHRPDSCPAF